MNTYGIQVDGNFEKVNANNMVEALKQTFSKNGNKTKTGEIDFSLLDFICLIPVPISQPENESRYQLFVVKEKGKPSEKEGKATNDLNILQKLLERKVKLEKMISAFIIDLYTGEVISWLWS